MSPVHHSGTSEFGPDEQDALITAFTSGALDPAAFHHHDHVRLTWALLCRMPYESALEELRVGLRRLVTAAGKPDRYHETITTFYASQIHSRMYPGEEPSWSRFAASNPDLLNASRAYLRRHYSDATLASEAARKCFVPPDIA